jgi:divalent metal cation (Fe/Co/Zn/Cd) transporter
MGPPAAAGKLITSTYNISLIGHCTPQYPMSEQALATTALPPAHRLIRRALVLSYFTVAYNVLEGLASIGFGALAGSTALMGFGVDSFVESLSGAVIIWRFHGHAMRSHQEQSHRESRAVRLVGVALLFLGLFVAYESVEKLYLGEPPERSVIGLVIACISLLVMPPLFYAKRWLGRKLDSRSLSADAKQTLACMFLSVALVTGVGLHHAFDLWQADPLAGLVIAVFLLRESWHAIRDQELCCAAE